MITMAKNPSVKTLRISHQKNRTEEGAVTIWSETGADELLMHRSWNSLRLIIGWASWKLKKEKPVLFVPEYYCYDTVFQIEDAVKLVYYPILESLAPDMKACRELAEKEKPDIFLFVHFWGKIFDGNDVSVFCRQNDAIFIEDAVHVLEPDRRIGRQSDFILFSPWKTVGLPDGAVLVLGKKNRYSIKKSDLEALMQSLTGGHKYPAKKVLIWKCKKLLQKNVPNFGKAAKEENHNYEKEEMCLISTYSKNVLTQITRQELADVAERRRENGLYLKDYCKRKYDAKPLLDGKDIPYMMPVCLADEELRAKFVNDFQKVGRIVSSWPNLAETVSEESLAYKITTQTVAIAVHDNLTPNIFVRKLKDYYVKTNNSIVIQKGDKQRYDECCSKVTDIVPLLQSSLYGLVKAETQKWKPTYYIVYRENTAIACFMVLTKKALVEIHRINQGVVWLIHPDKDIKRDVYQKLARTFSGKGKLLFLAAHEERNAENIALMVRNHLMYRKRFYATGYLDLSVSEETLRKQLDSKWRNQLTTAENRGISITVTTDPMKLESLLKLHIQHKQEANYKDAGDDISRELIRRKTMRGYYIEENDDVLAFIMIVLHGSGATYYISWNSKEGYGLNLNKLLLWNSFVDLKEQGIQWFDLGGINLVRTSGVSEFKLGTGCRYYATVGEYIKGF